MSSEEQPDVWFGHYEEDLIREAERFGERCAVYFLITGDELMYVGCSVAPYARIREHGAKGRIPFDCHHVVWFASQESAERAEYEAIRTFDPPMSEESAPSHVKVEYSGKSADEVRSEKFQELLRAKDISGAARIMGRM